MSCAKWPLFMAWLSTILYACSLVYMFTDFFGLEKSEAEKTDPVDPDARKDGMEEGYDFSDTNATMYTITLVMEVVMFIASVLLIVGVHKQNLKLMAPWIFALPLAVLCYWVDTFFGSASEDIAKVYFVIIFLMAAIWYPIYSHYKSVRDSKCQQPQADCVEKGCPQLHSTTFSQCGQQPATAPIHL